MAQEEKSYQIGKQIIAEHDLQFTVEYGGEIFTLRYPNIAERASIEAEISRNLGNQPRSNFSAEHVALIEATVYAQNLVIPEKSPKWFTNAWTCPDEELLSQLYIGYFQFRGKLREKLRTGGFKPVSEAGST